MKYFIKFWNKGNQSLGTSTFYLLIMMLLLRIVSLALYPLMDTTEGRYGEIARKMAEMNDWVTPWFGTGVPFWGKPPLAFWMSALGIKIFGVNEFAVRFPQFLASLLVVIVAYNWAKRILINPFYVIAILSSSFLFMAMSGAVTTDMVLCAGSTLSISSFWLSLRGIESDRVYHQYLFFIGLSIMLLAKGPVGWVLVLMPIGLWAFLTGSIKETWKELSWFTGCILAILVALPWYLLAEKHTPGFLNYFFVGEHWKRFTVPGWNGDLYGTAHARPRGSIWLFLVAATFPWFLIYPVSAWLSNKKNNIQEKFKDRQFKLYLLLTGLSPCIFFTMSGNVLITYVLPGIPSLALLLTITLGEIKEKVAKKLLFTGVLIGSLTMGCALILLTIGHIGDSKSAKAIVDLYNAQQSSNPLVFFNDRQFSSMFYSRGKVINVKSLKEVDEMSKSSPVYIAITKSQSSALGAQSAIFTLVGDGGDYHLFLRK
jgi:4-amino-4-deoxy-L-arabinose transferase-like glycosyltransferase